LLAATTAFLALLCMLFVTPLEAHDRSLAWRRIMKLAITSQDRTHITEHAGHCRRFWIYDIVDAAIAHKTFVEVPANQTFHEFAGRLPAHLQDVDVLITGGMGQSLTDRLSRNGITGLVTSETQPDAAVSAYLSGNLATITPEHTECGFGEGPHHAHAHAN
jgi:predicted Fe-Mo cluster-binding NifX family protein